MSSDYDYFELVRQAQLGNKKSLDELVGLVQGRVYAYIYRIILRKDASQEIFQESMLEMIRVLGKLERPDRFWPWLLEITLKKIHRYYSQSQRDRVIKSNRPEVINSAVDPEKSQAGLADIVGEDLKQIVLNAVEQLSPQQRMVLAMRCYERMEYSQIAESMNCSELNVRVLFHRAKKALRRQLGRSGLRRKFLLPALILFGKMTAPAEAAAQISITSATLKVGVMAGAAGIIGNKTAAVTLKAIAVSVTAAGGFTIGNMTSPALTDKAIPWVEQTINAVRQKPAEVPAPAAVGKNKECWYYYPANTDGPVMMRIVEYDQQGGLYRCWMQDEQANYCFDGKDYVISINNHRVWNDDLSVWRLPADKSQMREFLSTVEGKKELTEYVPFGGNGSLIIVRQNGANISSQVISHNNVPDEEYFRYDWPSGAKIIDNRDAMHKRGWTYFKITGEIEGEKVTGAGRIPFVYSVAGRNKPWLKLKIANKTEIVSSDEGTCIRNAGDRVVAAYTSESLFKGLARPWLGLHTIDTIRRDAAEKEVQFETRYIPGDRKANVMLTKKLRDRDIVLNYTIDMEKDVIYRITFSVNGDSKVRAGELIFSYLEDIENVGGEFAEPMERGCKGMQQKDTTMTWLMELAQGSFD
jgi:RNA polymerase sigma-70 factor (ECF subfamily)